MRGGERFYSQGRRPSQVFPYKEESGLQRRVVSKGSVSVPAWTRLQGVGPRKFSQPLELVCGIFPGHTSTCPTFHTGEQNSKPLQYSCLEKPMNSMKRQKDTILKDHIQVGICPICYWRQVEK